MPLMNRLRNVAEGVKQVWLADDATGTGSFIELRKWWDTIIEYGSRIGYHVNQKQTYRSKPIRNCTYCTVQYAV